MAFSSCFLLLIVCNNFQFISGQLNGPTKWRDSGDIDCGQSRSRTLLNQYDSDGYRAFVPSKSTVTFSTCNSASDYNTVLNLYSYPKSSAVEIDDCDNRFIGGCGQCSSSSAFFHQTWDITLESGFYYIEVYAISDTQGSYTLEMSCVASPTTTTTKRPTTAPSSNPSNQPSSNPTGDPTSEPTTEPTTEPTQIPSKIPSSDPSIGPTADPTIDPTNDPTSDPSMFPSKYPTQKPSFLPTLSDNNGEAENQIVPSITNTNVNKVLSDDSGMDLVTILVTIICVLVVVILIGAIGCYFCFISKKRHDSIAKANEKAQEMIEFGHVAPSNGTSTGGGINPAIMRVVSFSVDGDGTIKTVNGEMNTMTNGAGKESDGSDQEIYDENKKMNAPKQTPSMTPLAHDSPGTKSFVVTPESKPLATPGNVSVDFMDINEMRQVTPGADEVNETELLNEIVENEDESDDDTDDDGAEDLMYGKNNKHRTSGK